MSEQPQPEVYRITSAATPRSDDQEARIGRYLLSMLIRTVCVVLLLVVHGPFRWVFAVGAIVLPYVAVIIANNSGSRRAEPVPGVRAPQPQALPTTPAGPADPARPESVISGEVVGEPSPERVARHDGGRSAA